MAWYPTLDDMERRSDGPQNRPRQVTDTQRRESRLPVIGTWRCYCGERMGHDWPGKTCGLPHPRRVPATACTCPPCWGGLCPPPTCPAHGQAEMIQVTC